MPSHTSLPTRSREPDSILRKATVAAGTLRDMSSSSQIPFLNTISAVSFAIFGMVQTFKVQRQEYVQLVEQIHDLLWVVIDLSVGPQTTALLPPSMLYTDAAEDPLLLGESKYDGQTEAAIANRQKRSSWRNARQASEIRLKGLLCIFSFLFPTGLAKTEIDEDTRHAELLNLASAISACTLSSSDVSSLRGGSSEFSESSNSLLSLLPATPKIFYGRDGEVEELVATLLQDSPRVAILGSGGIGKTSLAAAVVHHPQIATKYHQRHFVACEAASTQIDLVHTVASQLQLDARQNVIVSSLAAGPPVLLVMDNLETAWEPTTSRARVEDFLSNLTDIPHLALLITMRGVERPGKVRWTRPFFPPLNPLSYEAAHQTFLDISDEPASNTDIDELLALTDRLPLAVSLVANLVSFEGSGPVLQRWKEGQTQLLSQGRDRQSNLDMSIGMSLSSPRMGAVPGAQALLSVISMLPDGIAEADLLQCALPIHNIEICKVTLLRTSLGYVDRNRRIKALVPVREYIQRAHPPAPELVWPVRDQLYKLLMLWKTFRQVSSPDCVARISANLGNLQSVLLWETKFDNNDVSPLIRRILTLDSFMRATGRGLSALRQNIPPLLERCTDHQLHGEYISALFEAQHYYEAKDMSGDPEARAIREFQLAFDPVGEVQLYNILATYHMFHTDNRAVGERYCECALALATEIGDFVGQGKALMHLSELEGMKGRFRQGVAYAQQSREAFGHAGHLFAQAHAIQAELNCAYRLGDFTRSAQLCAEARYILTLCGMQRSSFDLSLMSSEAESLRLKTEYAKARVIEGAIAEKSAKGNAPLEYAYALMNSAILDFEMGVDEAGVRQNLDRARPLLMGLKAPETMFWCDSVAADLQLRQGWKADAAAYYKQALKECWGHRPTIVVACLSKLGDVEHGMHDARTTFGYAVALLGYARKLLDEVATHHALRCIGDIFAARGDDDTALNLFQTAFDGFSAMGVYRHQGVCLVRIADVFERRGDFERATNFLEKAKVMFERSSQADKIALIESKLESFRS
ncbi:CTLH domain-containing protein [Mycena venus]|uniref:CTLH domain-containing protein n=1 Tax=Mycena venus TaxID=2733690 RepID=A0A8H7CQZ9_9AGAR|nr:CTLH domain-containing protein [Mycena venus]